MGMLESEEVFHEKRGAFAARLGIPLTPLYARESRGFESTFNPHEIDFTILVASRYPNFH